MTHSVPTRRFSSLAAATSIINEHAEGIRGTTLTTLGSTENLELLRRGRLDIGAAGSVPLYEAYRGEGAFKEPITSLRTLYVMYRSEEHTYDLQSLMRISYAVICLKKKKNKH